MIFIFSVAPLISLYIASAQLMLNTYTITMFYLAMLN